MTFLAIPVFAQTPRAAGPFAGLFGAASDAAHTLDLRGSGFGMYQMTFLPPDVPPDATDPFLDQDFTSLGASGSLAYTYRRVVEGSNFYFGGRGTASKFTAREEFPWEATANAGGSTRLSQTVTFNGAADAGYSPYYGLPTFDQGYTPSSGFGQNAGLVGQPGYGAVLFQPTITMGGNASLNTNLTRRTTLYVSGDYREQRLLDNELNTTRNYSAGAGITHQLWRYLSARAGYRRQVSSSEFPGSARIVSNVIDASLDFNYSGSFEIDRRTTFRFGTSSSVITSNAETHFRVNGSVGIVRALGRTWRADANYVRDSGYHLGFSDILLSDTASASLSGQLGRRLSSSSFASWQRGQVGFENDNAYTTTTLGTNLNYALTRNLGLYAQYSFFHYTSPTTGLTVPFYDDYSRQVVSAGLTAFVPLINTGRMNRDSR